MQCSTKTCAQQRTTAHNSAQLRCFENGSDDFGVEAFWIEDAARVGYFVPLNGPLNGHPPSLILPTVHIDLNLKTGYIEFALLESYADATHAVMLSPAVAMEAEVHCQRPPAGAQSLANFLHNASRWMVIVTATAGLNITAGVASQLILTRRILYSPTLINNQLELTKTLSSIPISASTTTLIPLKR